MVSTARSSVDWDVPRRPVRTSFAFCSRRIQFRHVPSQSFRAVANVWSTKVAVSVPTSTAGVFSTAHARMSAVMGKWEGGFRLLRAAGTAGSSFNAVADEDEEEEGGIASRLGGGSITPLRGRPPRAPKAAPSAPYCAPFCPPTTWVDRRASSRTMRRLKIVFRRSFVREKTPASSSSHSSRVHSSRLTRTRLASCWVDIARPFSVRWPYGSPWCMWQFISCHSPRAVRLHDCSALSESHSPQ